MFTLADRPIEFIMMPWYLSLVAGIIFIIYGALPYLLCTFFTPGKYGLLDKASPETKTMIDFSVGDMFLSLLASTILAGFVCYLVEAPGDFPDNRLAFNYWVLLLVNQSFSLYFLRRYNNEID